MQLGGFLGDYVKGRLPDDRSDIQRGIQLHRAIDAYTDHHRVIAESRLLFPKKFRRYAGIMLDILFDHLLAKQWDTFYDESLPAFSSRTLSALLSMQEEMPERAQLTMQRMQAANSLAHHGELVFVSNSFRHLATRLRRDNPLPEAFEASLPHLDHLGDRFTGFYPELMDFCDEWRRNQ